jgi:hypothetical protein
MEPDDLTAMYQHYIAELSRIGRREFKLTPAQSRNMAHEVLLASVAGQSRIGDMRTWLTAAMRAAARGMRAE